MLWIAFLVLTSVLHAANSQQGQNFFFGADNRQPARFVPFQQTQFAGAQQFVNYFPQTNAGPFLPFRASDPRVQQNQDASNKFQRQQFNSPTFAESDARFDSLISPGTFTSTGEEFQNFHDTTQDGQRFTPETRETLQFRQLTRFPPVAISEVTRSQDNPNSPNLIQTHSFNVHHTTRHPDEATRWRTQDDFNFRARNVPNQQFTSPRPTEDLFKFNRFHVSSPEPAQHFEVDKKGPKNQRVKANIPPTTYAPVSDRIQINDEPTTRRSVRGRNKFTRPDDIEKTTKAAKIKTTIQTRSPSSTTEESYDGFDVVTMSQDHLFVSEDNFKGFVDSAVIDSTEVPTTEEYIEDTTVAPSPPVHSSVKKKVLPPDPKTEKTETKSGIIPSTTEAWIIVASVQTSRSVSGARFIPSSAIKQEQHPLPLDSKSIKDVKALIDKKNIDNRTEVSVKSVANTTKASSTVSTESIIEKLDQVQSELSSGILSAFSQDKQTSDVSSTTLKPSTSASSDEETSTRKFVPSSKRTTPKPKTDRNKLFDNIQFDNLSGLLPPGFKGRSGFTPKNATTTTQSPPKSETTTTEKSNKKEKSKSPLASLKHKIKFDDVSAFLPPGYKPPEETSEKEELKVETTTKTETKTEPSVVLSKAKPVDISSFLPPGFKLETATENVTKVESVLGKIQFKETNELIPPDYTTTEAPKTTTKSETNGTKVVFPSRPGGNKKPPPSTQKSGGTAKQSSLLPFQVPHIQKGWPVRSTTEFTGWPSPSPSPISIEKLLQAAKEAATKEATEVETTTVTTTSTTTTTTRRPTTPGICSQNCDLYGSIRLVGGVKWVPELLDPNTKEWRTLANEVQHQLEHIFQSSEALSRWYRSIKIDAFSNGSVIVDYFVGLSDLGRTVNTADMKRLFHDTLVQEMVTSDTFTLSNNSDYRQLKLGKFVIDPTYTDFTVIQRSVMPAVRMTEQDMWLPQWAIAVIVIGLASLLFVLIFGITVVISRHKNSKKHPTALTEEMLNELNKSHMGGFENYGADDLYNMEDVWNEKPFKKRSSYYQDGSMPNIYDSWRSGWNGYYGNSYYNGSVRSGYSRRRSDYDTNF